MIETGDSGCISRKTPDMARTRENDMELNKKNVKRIFLIVAASIVFYLALKNLNIVLSFLGKGFQILAPVIARICIAFILNVFMRVIEEHLFRPIDRKNWRLWKRMRRPAAVFLTYLFVAGIIALILFLIIPQLVASIKLLIGSMPTYIDQIQTWYDSFLSRFDISSDVLRNFEWSSLLDKLTAWLQKNAPDMLQSAIGTTMSVASGIFSFVLGVVFAGYILMQKEKLCLQAKKLTLAFLPERIAEYLISIGKLTSRMFYRFVTGQLTEAVIIGILCFAGMTILRIPYAPMISALIGFTALIPIFGALIGTAVGALIILMDSPIKAVWFVLYIIIMQQFEGDFIYPRVVGSSVGLPSLWVMLAVLIGGDVGGITGMLVSVPIASILYCLVRQAVNKNLRDRDITDDVVNAAGVALEKQEESAFDRPVQKRRGHIFARFTEKKKASGNGPHNGADDNQDQQK